MSSVEKFDTSNLDILRVILDVLIVKRVEKILIDAKITDSILCFKYIIHLYLNNINIFKTKFEQTYNTLKKSKDTKTYTSIISMQEIFKDCPTKTYKPFENLNIKNPFITFDIDNFFKDNFLKDNFNEKDNGIRMKKRGLVYFIKFTPYILLLNHIMETDIDADNIETLKEYIKNYAPDIRNINTFSSFTQQEQPKNIESLAVPQTIGLAAHIDANADEYIKLNKLIFDLEKKVVDKIEEFQNKGDKNTTRKSNFDLFNRSIGEVTRVIKSNVTKYSLDMIEAYKELLFYLNYKYIPLPVIERGSYMIEKERPFIPALDILSVKDTPYLSPTPSERIPPSDLYTNTEQLRNSTSSPEAQKKQIQELRKELDKMQNTTTREEQLIQEEPAKITNKPHSSKTRPKSAPPPYVSKKQSKTLSSGEDANPEIISRVSSNASQTSQIDEEEQEEEEEDEEGEGEKAIDEEEEEEGDKARDEEGEDTKQEPKKEKNTNPDPRLPYNEEELKQKYLYTQKYKDGIDEAELEKLLKLKSDNSDNLYNDQYSINQIVKLSSYIDIFNKRISGGDATREDKEDIIAKLKDFENDPKNPIDALEIKFEDRLVFIIATFFIRYVAISMIQRGIDINLITTFYDGFIYYGCIYLVLFWFVVLFINIDDKYTTKYIDTSGFINYIRSLFYYFYMGTNGISRLLIHSLLLIVIIIIPIILNIKNKNNINTKEDTGDTDTEPIVMLTLEERTKLSKLLSVFTLFIWILTSIIATKF